MFKMLLQNNYLNISKFKTNLIRKLIKFEIKSIKFEMRLFKFESTSLIFNNNKTINVININFNVFKLNALNSKIYIIKNLIVNSHSILLSIRYNVFNFSPFNSIISFQIINSFAIFKIFKFRFL